MSRMPLMPKGTAVWLVENTSLTFDQIAEAPEKWVVLRAMSQIEGPNSSPDRVVFAVSFAAGAWRRTTRRPRMAARLSELDRQPHGR